MNKTVQIQVFSNWYISIRYSELSIWDWIEKEKKQWWLISNETYIGQFETSIYCKDDIIDWNLFFHWYTLYFLNLDDFLSTNRSFEYLWKRLKNNL
jgi:hypothetical protein